MQIPDKNPIKTITKEELILILSARDLSEIKKIFKEARKIRKKSIGNKVYTRGIIELSNICRKNCLYCGLRSANNDVERYLITEQEVRQCVEKAAEKGYTSFVLQTGERNDKEFINYIDRIVQLIQRIGNDKFRITLSCGEQSIETYQRWKDSGADRYLLRIETSDRELYYQIHPQNAAHSFDNRLKALEDLKSCGYQVGSGIMIGLPGQTIEHIANDLLFLKEIDVDMAGMGPYLLHPDTPMVNRKNKLPDGETLFNLSLLSIAALRLLMPDINIATATALDTLHIKGRLRAIKAGANVLMPNITPLKYRDKYFLYHKKAYLTEDDKIISLFEKYQEKYGFELEMEDVGDSKAYLNRNSR